MAHALGIYLETVDECAPGLVEGLYVVGSYALGDWHEGRSDIDIVAVTAEPATDEDAGVLITAHSVLAERLAHAGAAGLHIDGPYVAWGDLITPPMGLHRPWALEGRIRHDGECVELNPVTWYLLARHGVAVRGPQSDRLGVYLDTDARTRFAVDHLIGSWRPLAAQVRELCAAAPGRSFDTDSLEWVALGALRLHHIAFRGGVISKAAAAAYGTEVAPAEFAAVLSTALDVRLARRQIDEVPAEAMLAAAALVDWCVDGAEAASPVG